MDIDIRPARLFGIIALLALAVGCLMVLRPFLSALLWAAILAFATWPACRMLRERLRLSPGVAAAVMVLLEFILVGIPIALAAPTSREEVDSLRRAIEDFVTGGIPGIGERLRALPWVGPYISNLIGPLEFNLSGLAELLQPYAGAIAQTSLSVLLALLSGLAELLVAILLSFFFFRDGPAIAQRTEAVMARLAGLQGRRLLELVANVTRGVVWGLIGTAVVQGVMTGFGLWVAGVPQPVLLGVVAGLISIFPVGAPLVWIPATIWLFTQGETGWAIFMGLYGALGISSVDNFIRPMMISRGADLPLLLTLLGALGGVFAFGFLGLFLGPVLLAVGYTLVAEFAASALPPPDTEEGGAVP